MRLQKKLVKSYKILNFWSTERIHRKIGINILHKIIKVYVEKIEKEYYNFLGLRSLPIMYHVSLFVTVVSDYLPVRIQSEPVLKFNTGVLRCQVPQSAASYTKVISWTRGSARLYPSARGGKKNYKNQYFKVSWESSLSHLWVIFESSLCHLCVTPESSLSHPWVIP